MPRKLAGGLNDIPIDEPDHELVERSDGGDSGDESDEGGKKNTLMQVKRPLRRNQTI